MTGFITINGVSSRDFGVVLSDANVYGKAERDVQTVSVPGRSGDLIIDNNRYKNVKYEYPCAIIGDFDTNFSAFINYIQSQTGYMRIEDSFHPDEFVLARYVGETNPKRVKKDRIGTFSLPFDRKPQRYLKSGEERIAFTSDGQIINTEQTNALPLVRVYGTGAVGIGEYTITIKRMESGTTYTDIDCDVEDAYNGTTNCNGNIALSSGSFWKLHPGINGVTKPSGVSRIEITPRWWRL